MAPTGTGENGQHAHPDLIAHRPRLIPELIEHRPGLTTIFGLSLANCHVISAPEGLIVVDAGHSADEGKDLRRRIRAISDAPIVALLLTHSHYTGGIAPLLDGDPAMIVAHPRLHANLQRRERSGTAASRRRSWLETGGPLPSKGPDAVLAPSPRWGAERAYVEPTHTVLPGEQLTLGGLDIDMWPGCFDTDDGLAFHVPQYDAVAHNLVVSQLPNFGSLGGGRYRDPVLWFEAMEHLLAHPPEHLLPCHGRPLSGRERIVERLEVNLQAVRHLYQGVFDQLGAGATVPDLIRDLQLPDDLSKHPDLRQLYGTAEHMVANFAMGEMGFWSGEPRDLLPLHPDDEAHHLARLCGGPDKLLAQAEQAHKDGTPAWALHLADAACRLQVDGARGLRATLLRQAGHECSAWTLRNTLLSLAEEDDPRKPS